MAQPLDADARRYWRVAYQRLADGRLLLDDLDRPKPAVYLGGYAVECILKALLIVATPVGQRADVVRSFRGPGGHDLLGLRRRLAGRGVHAPLALAEAFSFVAGWSVDLRYEPGDGDRDEAREFIVEVVAIVGWADRRI